MCSQCCQVAAVTATFLKCGSFLKQNGRENLWPTNIAVKGFSVGKTAVIWQFEKLTL
jgi:hypothetical protein